MKKTLVNQFDFSAGAIDDRYKTDSRKESIAYKGLSKIEGCTVSRQGTIEKKPFENALDETDTSKIRDDLYFVKVQYRDNQGEDTIKANSIVMKEKGNITVIPIVYNDNRQRFVQLIDHAFVLDNRVVKSNFFQDYIQNVRYNTNISEDQILNDETGIDITKFNVLEIDDYRIISHPKIPTVVEYKGVLQLLKNSKISEITNGVLKQTKIESPDSTKQAIFNSYKPVTSNRKALDKDLDYKIKILDIEPHYNSNTRLRANVVIVPNSPDSFQLPTFTSPDGSYGTETLFPKVSANNVEGIDTTHITSPTFSNLSDFDKGSTALFRNSKMVNIGDQFHYFFLDVKDQFNGYQSEFLNPDSYKTKGSFDISTTKDVVISEDNFRIFGTTIWRGNRRVEPVTTTETFNIRNYPYLATYTIVGLNRVDGNTTGYKAIIDIIPMPYLNNDEDIIAGIPTLTKANEDEDNKIYDTSLAPYLFRNHEGSGNGRNAYYRNYSFLNDVPLGSTVSPRTNFKFPEKYVLAGDRLWSFDSDGNVSASASGAYFDFTATNTDITQFNLPAQSKSFYVNRNDIPDVEARKGVLFNNRDIANVDPVNFRVTKISNEFFRDIALVSNHVQLLSNKAIRIINSAVTPSNVNIQQSSSLPSYRFITNDYGKGTLYITDEQKSIIQATYSEELRKDVYSDVTQHCQHLFRGKKIVDALIDTQNTDVVFVLLDDGQLLHGRMFKNHIGFSIIKENVDRIYSDKGIVYFVGDIQDKPVKVEFVPLYVENSYVHGSGLNRVYLHFETIKDVKLEFNDKNIDYSIHHTDLSLQEQKGVIKCDLEVLKNDVTYATFSSTDSEFELTGLGRILNYKDSRED